MDKIKLAIADDHAVFRQTFRFLLEQEPDFSVIAEVGDGLAAVELVEQHHPDVLLIDVRLPRLDGIKATGIITKKHPATKVICLTLFTEMERERLPWKPEHVFACPKRAASPECLRPSEVATTRQSRMLFKR